MCPLPPAASSVVHRLGTTGQKHLSHLEVERQGSRDIHREGETEERQHEDGEGNKDRKTQTAGPLKE